MKTVGPRIALNNLTMETTQLAGSMLIEQASNLFGTLKVSENLGFQIKIGHTRIRIHVASRDMRDLIYPALAWGQDNSTGEPDVEIFALDGPGVIESPWTQGDFIDGGRIRGLSNGEVLGSFDIENSMLNLFDRTSNRGLFWVQSLSELPEWEFGAPLRRILEWALIDRGLQVMHCAAVGIESQSVLLCGPGGSGKSTTTALCLANGFQTTGDDYCAVSVSAPHRVYGIYGLIKLVPGSMGTEGFVNSTSVKERADGKAHFNIEDKMKESFSVKAVVFPKVKNSTQEPNQLTKREALIRLMGSTLNQATNPQPEILEALGSLAKSVKTYELKIGSDFDKVRQHLVKLCSN